MQTSPAVEQIKTLDGPRVCGISPVGKEKVYGGNDLPKSQVFSSEWKTERVREDASGDREDGEEDDDGTSDCCAQLTDDEFFYKRLQKDRS